MSERPGWKAALGCHLHGVSSCSRWEPTTMSRDGITGFIVERRVDHSYPYTCWSTFCTEKPDSPLCTSDWCRKRNCAVFNARNIESSRPKCSVFGRNSAVARKVHVSSWRPVRIWMARRSNSCIVVGLCSRKNGSFRSHHIYKSQ